MLESLIPKAFDLVTELEHIHRHINSQIGTLALAVVPQISLRARKFATVSANDTNHRVGDVLVMWYG